MEQAPPPALTDHELLQGFFARQRRRRAVGAAVLGAAILVTALLCWQLS
ncbi:hypothetical protein [Streptacidiphilus sp. PAMC 29251]